MICQSLLLISLVILIKKSLTWRHVIFFNNVAPEIAKQPTLVTIRKFCLQNFITCDIIFNCPPNSCGKCGFYVKEVVNK